MTGHEAAEERERNALQQRRQNEREAAALAAADIRIEAQEAERQHEAEVLAADWVADTQLQLQLSQLSYLDADLHQPEQADSSSELSDKQPSYQEVEPGSQAQPLEILSDSEVSTILDNELSDGEPRRSGCIKKLSAVIPSQQWQIEHGLIPAPGAKGNARALNAKKKKRIQRRHS